MGKKARRHWLARTNMTYCGLFIDVLFERGHGWIRDDEPGNKHLVNCPVCIEEMALPPGTVMTDKGPMSMFEAGNDTDPWLESENKYLRKVAWLESENKYLRNNARACTEELERLRTTIETQKKIITDLGRQIVELTAKLDKLDWKNKKIKVKTTENNRFKGLDLDNEK